MKREDAAAIVPEISIATGGFGFCRHATYDELSKMKSAGNLADQR
jgi:hypothetical protein